MTNVISNTAMSGTFVPSVDDLLNTTGLSPIINAASDKDLDILVDYITDRGAGRLMLDGKTCRELVRAKERGSYTDQDRMLIFNEILHFGGNTIGNLFRKARNSVECGGVVDALLPDARPAVPYSEIVRDVASHLKVEAGKNATAAETEAWILRKILGNAVEKMTEEDRRAVLAQLGVHDKGYTAASLTLLLASGRLGGFATYKMAAIVANAVARALLGHGLSFGATGVMMRGISVALGPIGWAVTALWTLADLASPAYRVTVPCVVQIAYIRQRLIASACYAPCPGCGEATSVESRFCASCGHALEKKD